MRYRNFFTLLVAVVLLALGSSRVHAATFTVSNLNDSGEGSLRQAILDANAAPGPDVIAFQAGLTGTIPLTSGELDITGDLEIQGPGPAALAVDGGLRSRLLVIERGVTAAVSSLTFRNGRPGFFDGGGIWNDGSLTLNGCTVSGNRTAGRGGGILNIGSLTLTVCTLSDNRAGRIGGGIDSIFGTVVLTDCVLSGNSAGDAGGGIHHVSGSLTLTRCTLAGNSASEGGAIQNRDVAFLTRCTLTGNSASEGGAIQNRDVAFLTRCTLSGNTAAGGGGGIANPVGTAVLTDCALSGNTAHQGGGIQNHAIATLTRCTLFANFATNQGGGIHNEAGEMTLQFSTVAGNSAADPAGGGIGGGIFNRSRLTVQSSTVNGNIATEGGGIYNHRRLIIEGPSPEDTLLTLGNSTLSGNRAFAGGGLVNGDHVRMTNCTLFGNRAEAGGGIRNLSDTGLELGNTLIANSGAGRNCVSDENVAITSLGSNLDSDGTCGLTQPSDQSGTPEAPLDPMVGPLQNNGGPTETHALSPGSPAVDAGDDTLAPADRDQRGFARIADGDRDGTARIDIGAFELSFFRLRDIGVLAEFLSYSTVQDQNTRLPAGTSVFPLTLYYSPDIAPRTFVAMLNGENITGLFHPGTPEGFETVLIPLRAGQNRLILRVKGRFRGHPAEEVDNLGFRVGNPPFGPR